MHAGLSEPGPHRRLTGLGEPGQHASHPQTDVGDRCQVAAGGQERPDDGARAGPDDQLRLPQENIPLGQAGHHAGLPDPPPYGADPSEEFRAGPHDTAQALVDEYLRTCARCRQVVSAGRLDDVIGTPSGTSANLRAILLHMIQEPARRNGHADTIREQIDGTTGY